MKQRIYVIIIIAAAFSAGLGGGRFFRLGAERTFIEQGSPVLLYSSAPVTEMFRMYEALSSPDEASRIAAYYTAVDIRLMGDGFLVKRFHLETEPVAKRAILYVLKTVSPKRYAELAEKYPELTRTGYTDKKAQPFVF